MSDPCPACACTDGHLTACSRHKPPELAHSLDCVTPGDLACECLPRASASEFARTLRTLFRSGRDEDAVRLVILRDDLGRKERDAAIRQVEEQRHPCPCGKDTTGIKWARCYSCRQREAEELSAAKNLLARIHRDGGHHTEEVGVVQSCADAEERWTEMVK